MAGARRRPALAFAQDHHLHQSDSFPNDRPVAPQRVVKRNARQSVRRSQRSTALEESGAQSTYRLPSPRSDIQSTSAKRKRTEVLDIAASDQPAPKRLRPQRPTTPTSTASNIRPYGAKVNWQEYFGTWPPEDFNPNRTMRQSRSSKRSYSLSRSNSYSQNVRNGASPVAWTQRHEGKMQEAGLIMDEYQTQTKISDASRHICDSILQADYDLPDGPAFREGKPLKVIHSVRLRNEARVFRDITPYVLPSAELLHLDGCPGLETIYETLNAEWTQCNTFYGPQPKPDMVMGISPSAFTNEEKEKLKICHTSTCPNEFPESMYFPFLICEVKSSNKSIQEAERQAMHSASIAVRAIIELYRRIPAAQEMDREVLVFSLAHDNVTVRIFGHFASIEDGKTTFFRHQLYVRDIAADLGPDLRARPYNIIRGIYEHFYPKHRARISAALARLSQDMDSNSQELASLSSQGQFKRPSLPSSSRVDQENEMLRAQVGDLFRELQQQREQMERQLAQQKEQMERQLAQQKEDSRQQKEQMAQQLAQQKEDSRQQKEMIEKQLAQQHKIVQLLENAKAKET